MEKTYFFSWHTRVFFNMMMKKKVCIFLVRRKRIKENENWVKYYRNSICIAWKLLRMNTIHSTLHFSLTPLLPFSMSIYRGILSIYLQVLLQQKIQKNVHDELNIFSLKAVYMLVTEWYVPEIEKYLEICDARSNQQTYI